MKYSILIFFGFIASIYIFLLLAVKDDKRWFQKFSQGWNKASSDTAIFDSLHHKVQVLSLTEALTSDCFWDRTNERGVIGGLNSCYRFLSNGQCFFYYYNFYNRKITNSVYRFEDKDVVFPMTWSAKGDTLLIAQGTPYKVLSFDKDYVIVEGSLKDTKTLQNNCQTILQK